MSIRVTDVTVAFGSRTVLREFSAEFADATVTALRAPSGFGKSTLLAVIAGHQRVDSGDVELGSATPADIVWIDQNSPVLGQRTALDNVAVGALARGLRRPAARRVAAAHLERVGLDAVSQRTGKELSGGERQRVAVARAMAARSGIILADEPTASLDADSRARVIAALRSAADAGAVVIVATHDDVVAAAAAVIIRLDEERAA